MVSVVDMVVNFILLGSKPYIDSVNLSALLQVNPQEIRLRPRSHTHTSGQHVLERPK